MDAALATAELSLPPNRLLLAMGMPLTYLERASALSPFAPLWTVLALASAMAVLAYGMPALAKETSCASYQALCKERLA